MEDLVRDYLDQRRAHFQILIQQIGGSLVLQAIASAMLLGIGGWLVINRQLALGQLVAAELVVTAVVSGFTKFGKHLEAYYDLAAALDKLGYLIDLPLESRGGDGGVVSAGPALVEFRSVSYSRDAGTGYRAAVADPLP